MPRRAAPPAAKGPESTDLAPRQAPTAHDVARLAGVSQSAVSRCFTPGASISEETRQRVRAAAEQLGYRPNLIARSLITRRSTLIGVVIPDLDNPFYANVLDTLSAMLKAAGFRILLFSAPLGESPDPVLDEVLNYRVAALILVSSSLSSGFAEECQRVGLPVVQLNRTSRSPSVSSVVGDNKGGAKAIAQFLLDGGHRRFAFIAGLESSSTSQERETAFVAALKKGGAALDARVVANYTYAGAQAATRELLGAVNPPDAIFCANDYMAIAAITTARDEFGARVGEDLSIVGFDDMPMAAWPEFSLTTYRQPAQDMCARAVAIIQTQIDGQQDTGVHDVIRGELLVRGSARRP